MDPPPPTSPNEKPTSIPDASPSAPCPAVMIKLKHSFARHDHRRIFYVLLCRQHEDALQQDQAGLGGLSVEGLSNINVPLMVAISVSTPPCVA